MLAIEQPTSVPARKKWDKDAIEALLQSNDRAVEKAVLVLFARQTEDERVTLSTKHSNNRGLTAYDAEYFSKLAAQLNRGQPLWPYQLSILRKRRKDAGSSRIGKYHRQLIEEIVAKQAAKQASMQALMQVQGGRDGSLRLQSIALFS